MLNVIRISGHLIFYLKINKNKEISFIIVVNPDIWYFRESYFLILNKIGNFKKEKFELNYCTHSLFWYAAMSEKIVSLGDRNNYNLHS